MARPPAAIWSRTAMARRFGREILVLVVLKAVLLGLLWVVAIKPQPRVPQTPDVVAKHLVAAPERSHDRP